MPGSRRILTAVACALVAAAAAAPAQAALPYGSGGPAFHLAAGQVPNDWTGDGNEFKFAGTPQDNNLPVNLLQSELCGIRGASVVDNHATYPFGACPPDLGGTRAVNTGWQVTTGRPDVTIAVMDSGIKWNDQGAMSDLRFKVRLNRAELPTPRHDGPALVPGTNCASCTAADDANGDGVFNLRDYACDPRVKLDDPRRAGPANFLVPQDLLIAFSDGTDADGNGFVDDIAGWDFMDNDNDAYDDVQYGHGTGEARDSSSEADNGDQAGTCPNCMFIPLRVGDSFVADVSRWGQAVLYATDNDVLVVQEALGALNNSPLAREANEYAYRHGVTVIASAADEAAQHHHWPEGYPHVIVVNSVRNSGPETQPPSYLRFNGCTNFSSKVTLAIPSTSCSSNATGLAAGMAGLIYSAAKNARAAGRLSPSTNCTRVGGSPCLVTANEVRQMMATGTISGQAAADDVNFASPNGEPEPSCSPTPVPACTDPNGALQALVDAHRPVLPGLVATRSYAARAGHDQFYGYGRVNIYRGTHSADRGTIPPEAEITSPGWFAQVDPGKAAQDVDGHVFARGAAYRCQVLVAPGSYPNNALASATPPGDFRPVPSPGVCDGTVHTGAIDGTLGHLDIADLKSRFPAQASPFNGPESGSTGAQTSNGRPSVEPFGFVVKLVATTVSQPRSGEDRRNLYLHRDQDLLPGWPKQLTGDGESSPAFADLNGDNRNEMIFGSADGVVHAMRPDGSELPGWPVRDDKPALHTGGHAFSSGEVSSNHGGMMLASVAVGDLFHTGGLEVVAADFEGKIYIWSSAGKRLRTLEANPKYSGKPLAPFVNVRGGHRNRTQHGFFASPVLADIDGNDGGRLEIVAAGMDRHVYAFNDDGSAVPGFPVLVVDQSKVSSVDPQTHAVAFKGSAGDDLNQGAIVDTPAVGDLNGDGKPEIVVGTNEEYKVDTGSEGPLNAGNFSLSSLGPLLDAAGVGGIGDSNGRAYAIKNGGDPDGPAAGVSPFLPGWPVPIARLKSELLPVVGEGITGSPVIGPATMNCSTGGTGPKIGLIPDGGPGVILNKDGTSCQGQTGGKNNVLETNNATGTDHPAIPAVGHPAFGNVAGGVSFLTPATGVVRALDIAVSEYQTGSEDFLSAYDPTGGGFRPGFPARMNDLQFLTGPSVADIDGQAGEEIVAASAYEDLQAFNSAGLPVSGWPKLTSDWVVANPLIGSFGTKDTDAAARKVVVSFTRDGHALAYRTAAPACSPGSWPRFHHDVANSGYYDRDAVQPGKPRMVKLTPTTLTFSAPGDDLLCGTATRYEVTQANRRIQAKDFVASKLLPGAPTPAAAGTPQSLALPPNVKAHVAIRAVDDQGNVGHWLDISPRISRTGPRPVHHPPPPPAPDKRATAASP